MTTDQHTRPECDQHRWEPDDDLSMSSPSGGYWALRTYRCANCGALKIGDWPPAPKSQDKP